MRKIHNIIGTVFGLGYLPFAPGTWGSLAGLGLCLALHGNAVLYSAVFICLFVVGVISAGKLEIEMGEEDPAIVIIDEFAGIFLIFLFVPLKLSVVLTGFVLYRIIDIVKFPPIRSIERLKGGWGIMLDDFMAGIYGNLILQTLIFFGIFA